MSQGAHDTAGAKRRLAVVVPNITDRFEKWEPLLTKLQELDGYDEAHCHWARVQHGGGMWSRSAAKLGRDVAAEIDEIWESQGGFTSVVLVGHSLGGICVRHAYMTALGAFDDGDRRDWADHVERVILFASHNRGIQLKWWMTPIDFVTRLIRPFRKWIGRDVIHGSAFILALRIAWMREINRQRIPPIITQILGSKDGLVTEDDSKDVESFPTGYQDIIRGATHSDVIEADPTDSSNPRFALIRKAFERPQRELERETGDEGQRIVILLHGIRSSNNGWPKTLEKYIQREWPGTDAIPATYGRFSAIQFMFPGTRRKFLPRLQDIYAEALATNPKATFHFIGHSNGTYLLGRSLDEVASMKFTRIALVGSVLPDDYEWADRLRNEQFEQLRNDRGASDVPVGFLCGALRGVGMTDVGTAGLNGFSWPDDRKQEVYYYPGGHSKALTDGNLQQIAKFVMDGADTAPSPETMVKDVTPWLAWIFNAAKWLGRLAAVGLVAGAAAFIAYGPWSWGCNLTAVIGFVAAVLIAVDTI
ncbi:MAG: hypothetical protein JWR34_2162 [Mycobacterium sp.]|nr:hypothetical protein [Mycobacterium sp.]